MKKKTNRFRSFLQKLRFQYRVSVLNENTLEESWHIRLSRLSVLIYGSSLVLGTFILLTILIFTTPIKYYLPGYGDTGNRGHIISESMYADSLLRKIELQAGYMDIMRDIIKGNIKPDSLLSLDSVQLKETATDYLEKSKKEKEFIEKYEREEKYNLSTIESKTNDNMYVFFRPAKGVISTAFNLQENQTGISIITAPNETVASVLAGTVVYAAFTFEYGWVIQVQHENNYLSIYKNNTRLLKKTGDNVKAGEGIAITGESGENKTGTQFYFELWKQGKPVNPEDVIIF
ncbi:MAG: M23 family metallopeptidase [Paludibacter sp.]|jgi:lipoprotein NlpD|nr:M23 family metallopeptidase [Paludibacter sp.]MDD3489750.1 M23 family metallopeptidase [Paludibacter sp.]